MAIAKIKKVELIGLHKDRDSILSFLQKSGNVELIGLKEAELYPAPQATSREINLLELEEAIQFLATFKEEAGFLEGIANIRPIAYQKELKETTDNFDWKAFLKELENLRNHLKDLLHHKEKLNQKRQLLLPWRRLALSMDEIHSTDHCGIILGVLSSRDYQRFLEDSFKNNINLLSNIISQDKTNTHLLIVYIKEDFERLDLILKDYHFNFTALGHYKGTVKDNLLEINVDNVILDDQIQDVKKQMAELSEEQFKLMIIYDYLSNINKINEADKNLTKQQFTFALSGWIKEKDLALFEKGLTNLFKEVAIFISEPKENEKIPVILDNKKLIQPFEFITQIYGMPQYKELDPTPFLAPFFFLYFGFCVSDVGYGIMLIIISSLALKKFRMGSQGKKFFRLFLFCGVSTIIIGALTGSWFGNSIDMLGESNKIFLPLKNFKDSLILLDPLKEPTKLLGIALCLGIIQVWFGNIVAAIGNIKNRRYLNIALDQLPMLTFLFGFTGLGLIFLQLMDIRYLNIFKFSIITGAICLIFTQGRLEKGTGSKLFYGVYNLYNAFSGYLSDILSYSRLWALGLVTGVMAGTINLIAVQFSKIALSLFPFVEKIFFIKLILGGIIFTVIFTFGHIASFLMSLLGAFVHPVRLQFVEFFSKFFKSGGRHFRPFKIETKYINFGYRASQKSFRP